jgi:hypothetical protein
MLNRAGCWPIEYMSRTFRTPGATSCPKKKQLVIASSSSTPPVVYGWHALAFGTLIIGSPTARYAASIQQRAKNRLLARKNHLFEIGRLGGIELDSERIITHLRSN